MLKPHSDSHPGIKKPDFDSLAGLTHNIRALCTHMHLCAPLTHTLISLAQLVSALVSMNSNTHCWSSIIEINQYLGAYNNALIVVNTSYSPQNHF